MSLVTSAATSRIVSKFRVIRDSPAQMRQFTRQRILDLGLWTVHPVVAWRRRIDSLDLILRKPQAQPVRVTFCGDDGLRRDRRRLGPKRLPFFFRDGAGQNQRVLRAGRGDVQQPQFLAPLLAALMLLREPVRQARISPARVRRLDARTQAERFVKNNFPAQVLRVERLGEIGDGHDGKFQPLALVNAHQPDGIFVRDRPRRPVPPRPRVAPR